MGELPQAVEQLEKAARLLPADGTVQEHLGDALRAAGKSAEARTAYRRALALRRHRLGAGAAQARRGRARPAAAVGQGEGWAGSRGAAG